MIFLTGSKPGAVTVSCAHVECGSGRQPAGGCGCDTTRAYLGGDVGHSEINRQLSPPGRRRVATRDRHRQRTTGDELTHRASRGESWLSISPGEANATGEVRRVYIGKGEVSSRACVREPESQSQVGQLRSSHPNAILLIEQLLLLPSTVGTST